MATVTTLRAGFTKHHALLYSSEKTMSKKIKVDDRLFSYLECKPTSCMTVWTESASSHLSEQE